MGVRIPLAPLVFGFECDGASHSSVPKIIFFVHNGARSLMVERLIVSQDHAGSNPVVHPR